MDYEQYRATYAIDLSSATFVLEDLTEPHARARFDAEAGGAEAGGAERQEERGHSPMDLGEDERVEDDDAPDAAGVVNRPVESGGAAEIVDDEVGLVDVERI